MRYSQFGQDRWIVDRFKKIERPKTFLEIGGCDGVTFSNTLRLEELGGWTGMLVEPHDGLYSQLVKNRPRCKLSNAVVDFQEHEVPFWKRNGWISGIVAEDTDQGKSRNLQALREARQRSQVKPRMTTTLDKLLEENDMPQTIDYFSLDVEGAEHRVLTVAVLEKYRFNVLTVERPKALLCERMKQFGYRPVKEMPGYDVFYEHESFLEVGK